MPAQRLQPMLTLSADRTQQLELAADISSATDVIVQVRRAAAAGAGSYLVLQHAASLDEGAFQDVGPGIDLSTTGNHTVALTGLLAFLRWRAVIDDGPAAFLIDILPKRR